MAQTDHDLVRPTVEQWRKLFYAPASVADALTKQVGGDHYKKYKIEPIEYIIANNIPFVEGCIIKRITRWRDKGGIQDLEKIKHEIDILIELEKKNNNAGLQ